MLYSEKCINKTGGGQINRSRFDEDFNGLPYIYVSFPCSCSSL